MKDYAATAVDAPDVALQLPTGSGKTLVGLMIAEWRRRKFRERIVYLCPTRQLVNQVVEQAEESYGLTVRGFTGPVRDYDPTARAEYQNADRIAVTTYSSLFNTNPFFSTPQVIIIDDAHAAENYIGSMWSLRVGRSEKPALHAALANLFKPHLQASDFARLSGQVDNLTDASWVDKIPTPLLAELAEELCAIIDAHVQGDELRFAWSVLRDNLTGSHVYLTSQEILLRPLIPPTWTHAPFANAKQRIFMSATLGAGGDLERLTGRAKIQRLAVPDGWDRQGIGRRFFVFPNMALKDDAVDELRLNFMERAGRSLVLVPSERARTEFAQIAKDALQCPIYSAADIEDSKKNFVAALKAVAIVANRYDGIDFPGDDCRLLLIDGLPRAMNAQERFLMSRMGANALFNERVQTRVLQAIGRCTRSLEDYSAVVVTGEELPDYLADRTRWPYFHPELQAELDFGVEQSKGAELADLLENFDIFLRNDTDWEEANDQIIAKRALAVQRPFPAMANLAAIVGHEIEFQKFMWQRDFESALGAAERVLGSLTDKELQGYRALWHYLAGSAAWLGSRSGNKALEAKARLQFRSAKSAAAGIAWLVSLSKWQDTSGPSTVDKSKLFAQLERVEAVLARLGKVHDRQFDRKEKEILTGLASADSGPFENAHKQLGEMLGFIAGNDESDAAPDPWWVSGKTCFVFEDHSGAQSTSALSATKARQAASHPQWIRANVPMDADAEIVPILVTPVTRAEKGAAPHLSNLYAWPLSDFRAWATAALGELRQLRRTFNEPGDLVWRAQAAEIFEAHQLDAASLLAKLKSQPAASIIAAAG